MKKLIALILSFTLVACVNIDSTQKSKLVSEFQPKADELLLVVSSNKYHFTRNYPGSEECEKDENCIPWSFWHVYDAKVLSVVHGEYDENKITFALLQHTGYVKEYTKIWYVLVKPITDQKLSNDLNVNYYVVKQRSKYFP